MVCELHLNQIHPWNETRTQKCLSNEWGSEGGHGSGGTCPASAPAEGSRVPQGRAVTGLRAALAGTGSSWLWLGRLCVQGWACLHGPVWPTHRAWPAWVGTRPACCQCQVVCREQGASGVEGLHRGCDVRRGCVGPPLWRARGLATPPRAAPRATRAVFSAPVSRGAVVGLADVRRGS